MVKYVVLARGIDDGYIVSCLGCFKNVDNAYQVANRMRSIEYDNDVDSDVYYSIEEVDPLGSYADMEVED